MPDVRTILDEIHHSSGERFRESQRIKSFREYVEDLTADPCRYLRTAAQYVADMFDFFGSEKVTVGEKVTRWRLFDAPFREGRERVVGQEAVQGEIYRTMRSFAAEGRSEKMILLHGPNGSSKTSLVNLIFRGLEHYSETPEGPLYRFNWIFPRAGEREGRLGFDATKPPGPARPRAGPEDETFAFLEHHEIAARLACELKDPPVFLIPRPERIRLIQRLRSERTEDAALQALALEPVLDGDLCGKCKAIYEGLLEGYQGDWSRVLAHVQVERYFISRRFRTGAVTIEPQLSVDAGTRQVSLDQSLAYLPPILQSLPIVEPSGDLVDANGGVVEYSDFLKRPLDLNKYLLATCEKGTVNLPGLTAHLNLVILASTNEKHLDAFKQNPDFTSFKARIHLVTVPYLLEYRREAEIYRELLHVIGRRKHVAPHTAETASLWAVLTRLQRPDGKHYPTPLRRLVERLTPVQKARLYDRSQVPDGLTAEERNLLRAALPRIRDEFRESIYYEGRFGASPREIKAVLSDASYLTQHGCVTPLAVLEVLQEFVKERSVYDFLKLEPNGGYNDNVKFIEDVRDEYLALVTRELEDAMDLVDVSEYERHFERYMTHVVAYTRSERVRNENTGEYESPSEDLMRGVERLLDVKESVDIFRKNLVGKVGAFRIDHPEAKVTYGELFPEIVDALKREFFTQRREQVLQVEQHLMRIGEEELKSLDPELQRRVRATVANLQSRFGYCDGCAREAIHFVATAHREKGGKG